MYYKKSAGEKVCTGLIYIFCIVLTLAFLYPVVYCLSMSISDAEMLGGQPIGMFQRIIMDVDSSENFEEMVDILPIEVRGGCYLTVVILRKPPFRTWTGGSTTFSAGTSFPCSSGTRTSMC